MRLKNLQLYIIPVIIGITGCSHLDETEAWLSDLNEAPQINFTSNPEQPVLTDSIKVGLKTGEEKYQISLKVTDKNKNISEVVYTQLNGTGRLKQNGIDIISNNITFQKDSSVLQFEYWPESIGLHRMGLKVKDNFELTNSVTIDIIAFENLRPIAVMNYSKVGTRGKYHYEIIAEESFDKDQKYGGQIVEYEYKCQGAIARILATTEDATKFQTIFPDKGIYRVEVRVRDNDGEWSDMVWREIVVD